MTFGIFNAGIEYNAVPFSLPAVISPPVFEMSKIKSAASDVENSDNPFVLPARGHEKKS
jgi:hypothetical protein